MSVGFGGGEKVRLSRIVLVLFIAASKERNLFFAFQGYEREFR